MIAGMVKINPAAEMATMGNSFDWTTLLAEPALMSDSIAILNCSAFLGDYNQVGYRPVRVMGAPGVSWGFRVKCSALVALPHRCVFLFQGSLPLLLSSPPPERHYRSSETMFRQMRVPELYRGDTLSPRAAPAAALRRWGTPKNRT